MEKGMFEEKPIVDVEPEIVDRATAPVVPAPDAPKEVKRRGRGVDLSSLDPVALAEHKAAINVKAKATQKAKKEAKASTVKSEVEIKPKEAREILMSERGIRNLRVVDICVEHAQIASRNLKIPFNRALFTMGLQGVLAGRDKKPLPEFPADQWHAGEKLRERDLYCLWDYAASWRVQPDGTTLDFPTWKACRRRCVTDLIWFGNTVLGKDFQPEPHGRWAEELFPKLEEALMSLPEKFGQKDIAKAFHKISDVRQRCLIAARSSFKSTVSLVFLHQINLAFGGSVRCMIISATQPLAKGFAANFRNTLTLRDPNNPTLMNQLWPEHCIGVDDGKTLEYTSPFRQLDMLIEPTVRSLSLITEGSAGGRYDYACYEDAAEISNSSTPEMRAKTQERVDLLRELGEPHSLTNYVGTPISAGSGTEEDPGDLYSVLLRREEINQKSGADPKLLYTICPAWTVKKGVNKKAWDPSLEPHEVELLFPSRLTFKYLMGTLKENLATDKTAKVFRQQSLCSWVPDEEEDQKVQFDHAEIWHRVKPLSYFEPCGITQTFLAVDRSGGSVSKYADFNAAVVGRVQTVNARQALVVVDARLEKAKDSELIRNVLIPLIEKHNPTTIIFEEAHHWADFEESLRRELIRRGIVVPYLRRIPIDNTPKAKMKRIARLELPLSEGRLYFNSGIPDLETCLLQLENYDPNKKSNGYRKEDFPDSLALLADAILPRTTHEPEDPEAARERERREEEEGREQDASTLTI
jgi:hypothetical protein